MASARKGRKKHLPCLSSSRHILFLSDDEEGYIEQYGKEEFSEYIKSLEDSEPEKARFLERYRQRSHPEDTFDPEGGDNEDEELEQTRDRRDWNKEWQSIFESLGAKGDVLLEVKWQLWHLYWIARAMDPTHTELLEAESVLKHVRNGLPDWWRPAFWIGSSRILATAAARATLAHRECRLYWPLLGGPTISHLQFQAAPAFLTSAQEDDLLRELQRRKAFSPVVRQGARFWSESTRTAEAWHVDYLCDQGYGLTEREQWRILREEGLVYRLGEIDADGGEHWFWCDWPYVPAIASAKKKI